MFKWVQKLWNALTSMRDAKGNLGKRWWRSKTLWVNFLAIIGLLTGKYIGIELDAETTTYFLGAINFVLRLITKEPVGFIDNGS